MLIVPTPPVHTTSVVISPLIFVYYVFAVVCGWGCGMSYTHLKLSWAVTIFDALTDHSPEAAEEVTTLVCVTHVGGVSPEAYSFAVEAGVLCSLANEALATERAKKQAQRARVRRVLDPRRWFMTEKSSSSSTPVVKATPTPPVHW